MPIHLATPRHVLRRKQQQAVVGGEVGSSGRPRRATSGAHGYTPDGCVPVGSGCCSCSSADFLLLGTRSHLLNLKVALSQPVHSAVVHIAPGVLQLGYQFASAFRWVSLPRQIPATDVAQMPDLAYL